MVNDSAALQNLIAAKQAYDWLLNKFRENWNAPTFFASNSEMLIKKFLVIPELYFKQFLQSIWFVRGKPLHYVEIQKRSCPIKMKPWRKFLLETCMVPRYNSWGRNDCSMKLYKKLLTADGETQVLSVVEYVSEHQAYPLSGTLVQLNKNNWIECKVISISLFMMNRFSFMLIYWKSSTSINKRIWSVSAMWNIYYGNFKCHRTSDTWPAHENWNVRFIYFQYFIWNKLFPILANFKKVKKWIHL